MEGVKQVLASGNSAPFGRAGQRPCSSSLGRAVSAGKEDVPGSVVPDEEQEGVVCIKGLSDEGRAHVDDAGGGGGGLRPLFVDVHISLVDHLGEDKVVPA